MKSSPHLRVLSVIAVQFLLLTPSHAILDTNSNGLSDIWEKQYNEGALLPNTFLPTGDQDQDGWNNITESIAGTNPFDANQPGGIVIPQIQASPAQGFFHIDHPTILGKTYLLQGSVDLISWLDINDTVLAREEQLSSVSAVSTTTGEPPSKFFWRVQIGDIDSDTDDLTDAEEIIIDTNPHHNDTDNDGIHDKAELLRALDPLNPDTDGDGLYDGYEDTILTNPLNPDTDTDGINDGQELYDGTNPLLADTDSDGLNDLTEKNHGTNPLVADTDGDGINDGQEITNGTSPFTNDTDLDGIADGQDTLPLINGNYANPDGIALSQEIFIGMTSLWDFEDIQPIDHNNVSSPNFANLITATMPARIHGPVVSLNGMISRSARFQSANHSLIASPQVLGEFINWTVSCWYKMPIDSLQNRVSTASTTFWAYNDTSDLTPDISVKALKAIGALDHQKIIITLRENEAEPTSLIAEIPIIDPLDNDTWQHLTVAKHNGVIKLYRNGLYLGQIATDASSYTPESNGYFAIGRLHQTAPENSSLYGNIDRFIIHNRSLSEAEIASLCNLDTDKDTVPDRIEAATAVWRDFNSNGLRESNETMYLRNPYVWEPITKDSDQDGLTDELEIVHNTRIANPDTDGDLIPDGWEILHGTNPLDSADASNDLDNDGLPNIFEYQCNSNPTVADTDNDGTEDGAEANGPDGNIATDDGSFPNDASDQGTRPASEEMITLKLGVGDRSSSHSENYALHVYQIQQDGTEKRIHTLESGGYGYYAEETRSFLKKYSYTFQIDWKGTSVPPSEPATGIVHTFSEANDFDYHLVVEPLSGNQGHVLIDSYDPRTKTADPTTPLLDPQDINPTDDDDDNVASFLETHEPKRVVLLRASILVDANRDGQFSKEDDGQFTEQNPWRIWINNDDDSGETGGTDGPSEHFKNYYTHYVDQMRDLIDFFPCTLKLKDALRMFPTAKNKYVLKTTNDTAYSPVAAAWLPSIPLLNNYGKCNAYLEDIAIAKEVENKKTHLINSAGRELPSEMTDQLHNGSGMMLIEGRIPQACEITLEIIDKSSNVIVGSINLSTSISSVMDMLRYKFVMPNAPQITEGDVPISPPNWPDTERNDKHFVFVHGYNVNDQQSKFWAAEIFKRMYHAGSDAKFTAFAWYGYDSQITALKLTPNYQVNLIHAIETAKSFTEFLNLLEGQKTVAAHSMGNVLVGAAMTDTGNCQPANYVMLNSAAAKECYDENEIYDQAQETVMIHPWWKNYMKQVRASEWHDRAWPSGDERKKLTWRGRLSGVFNNAQTTQVYNFYSSGEEVLNNPQENNPDLSANNPSVRGKMAWLTANKTWAMQEKRKGWGLTGVVHSSNYGGWYPNIFQYDPVLHVLLESNSPWRMRLPSEIPNSPLENGYGPFVASLMEKPFFDSSQHAPLFDFEKGANTQGSNYAKQHASKLISEMIPCTTLATGRNPLIALGEDIDHPVNPGNNVDMHRLFMTDPQLWPYRPKNHDPEEELPRAWCHSDIREIAYTHNWKAFKKIVEIGNLK